MRRRWSPLLLVLALACSGCALLRGPKRVAPDSYRLEFEGLDTYSEDQLIRSALADLNDFVKDGYRKSAIDDAAYAIERHYRDRGFPFARVEYTYEAEPGALPLARFLIEEGPRTELVEAIIDRGDEANDVFPSEELEALFLPNKRGRTWYIENDVSSAASSIASLFVSRGYLDVAVSAPEVTFNDTRDEARVRVAITPGRAYVVGSIGLEGDLVLAREELVAALGIERGAEFFPRLPYEVRGRLADLYANRGHADIEVEVKRTIDEANGEVDLVYEIAPGPVVTIVDVRVVGNEETLESFVLKRLGIPKGSRYSRKELRDAASRLYETGLFSRVELGVPPDNGEERAALESTLRTLLVELDESSSKEIYVTPGWGSYEQARVTAGVRGRNFFGTGRTIKAEGTLSTRSVTGTVTLTDPYFLGSNYTTDLSLFGNRREEPSFTRLENGATLSFSRNWTRTFRTVAGYEYRRSDAIDIDPDAADIENNVRLSTLFFSPTLDTRDNFLSATKGSRNSLGVEWSTSALGSQLDFLRLRLYRSQYHALGTGTVLAMRAQTGLIFPISDTTAIPIQERFFNGGEDSVRSFREDELGPKDASGNPVGGEAFTLGSVELRQRIAGAFGGALFYDIGNVSPTTSDYLDFADFRSGVGLGARYMLPIGPLRLDAAWNPDARDDEDDFVVHFAVGMAF